MTDPIASLVELLQPLPDFTKLVVGSGSWTVRREEVGRPFCCAVLEGSFNLVAPPLDTITLSAGDFVLIPFARAFQTFSLDRSAADRTLAKPFEVEPRVFRVGTSDGVPDMRHLIGYGIFGSDDALMLASLLPPVIHVRGEPRLTTLLQLIDDEVGAARSAKTSVLTRLLELLMIETLRSASGVNAAPGLLRGMADERLSSALRAIHQSPCDPWTVARLAKEAGLSRSAFFDRFGRTVKMTPMAYLLHWRMLLAKKLLRVSGVSSVAEQVGYSSVSSFSAAFTQYAGMSPRAYIGQKTLSADFETSYG